MTGTARLAYTALLFALALGLLGLTTATHSAVPLFFMWLPLLGVPWVLTRPEPEASPSIAEANRPADQDAGDQEPTPEP
jgi:hypothetical protein